MDKCEKCGSESSIMLRSVLIGGNESSLHLCNKCREKMSGGSQLLALINGEMIVDDLEISGEEEQLKQLHEMKCPECKTSLLDVGNVAKFGCEHCYEVFSDLISVAEQKIATKEENKIETEAPLIDSKKTKIKLLEKSLREAIDKEDYLLAAELRDELKSLKGSL